MTRTKAKREYEHPLVIEYTPPRCPCGSESFIVYRTVPTDEPFTAKQQYAVCRGCGGKRFLYPAKTFQDMESRFSEPQ